MGRGAEARVSAFPLRVTCWLAALLLSAAAPLAQAAERKTATCTLVPTETVAVTTVVDARTLRLADGTQLRLAGLAGLDLAGVATAADRPEAQAEAALDRLVHGKSLSVQVLATDRYGRRLALAALADATARPSVQHRLIAAGYGLVADQAQPPGCAADLLTAERAARTAKLGVWADPYYLIRQAARPAAVSEARGRFALVEGKVLSVRDRGATTYVNFGRRWSEDFTVTIAKRNARNFAAAGLEPKSLVGRQIRIRGWIDERGGPWIDAIQPEQIEFTDRD
jgi:endonuclease YncB( thermonuclease family)